MFLFLLRFCRQTVKSQFRRRIWSSSDVAFGPVQMLPLTQFRCCIRPSSGAAFDPVQMLLLAASELGQMQHLNWVCTVWLILQNRYLAKKVYQ